MKEFKDRRSQILKWAILIFCAVMAMRSSECDCKTSDATKATTTTTTTTPADPNLTIVNNYGAPIYYEIWSGTDLEYRDGAVLGNSLSKKYPIIGANTLVANGGNHSPGPISYNSSFLIIFGVDDSGIVYVNSQVFSAVKSDKTVTIYSTGSIQ